MIRREHRRLDRAFSALLMALAPCAAAQACSSSQTPDGPAMDGLDAQSFEAAAGDEDYVDSAKPIDAGPDIKSCFGSVFVHDAGLMALDADAGEADADIGCDYAFPCGLPPSVVLVGCEIWVPYPDGAPAGPLGCRVPNEQCLADAYSPNESGAVSFSCIDCVGGGGRRPSGLRKARVGRSASARGAYFARMAYDEAASVHAFLSMRDELTFHGAPSALVRGASLAARDEVRHARLMGLEARAEGTEVPKVRMRRRSAPRTLLAIALENAVEGCVHETFGALLLRWQTAHTDDASLRRMFGRIAKDEARHAALSWAVASWVEAQLDPTSQRRVANARRKAMQALEQKVPLAVGLGAALGLAS